MEKYSCLICGYANFSPLVFVDGICEVCAEKVRILAPISRQIRESLEREKIAVRT
jgi:hypothetical protein